MEDRGGVAGLIVHCLFNDSTGTTIIVAHFQQSSCANVINAILEAENTEI